MVGGLEDGWWKSYDEVILSLDQSLGLQDSVTDFQYSEDFGHLDEGKQGWQRIWRKRAFEHLSQALIAVLQSINRSSASSLILLIFSSYDFLKNATAATLATHRGLRQYQTVLISRTTCPLAMPRRHSARHLYDIA